MPAVAGVPFRLHPAAASPATITMVVSAGLLRPIIVATSY
jgi:hypothetical protein